MTNFDSHDFKDPLVTDGDIQVCILQHKLLHMVILDSTSCYALTTETQKLFFQSSSEAWAEATDLPHHPVLQNSSWHKQMITAQIV